MKLRPTPLPEPPERRPYLRARLWPDEAPVVLRLPSTTRMGELARSLTDEQRGKLLGVASQLENGRSLLTLLVAAEEALPLIAGLLGTMWADPVRELETARGAVEDLGAYGARLLEELHEAGFEPRHLALLAISVVADLKESADLESVIDEKVAARAAFFRRPKVKAPESGLPSNTTSSDPSGGDASTS